MPSILLEISNNMDGDFYMKKWIKLVILVLVIFIFTYGADLLRDQNALENNLVRLHVVANSDSQVDQQTKLLVRDKVTGLLEKAMGDLPDAQAALEYLRQKLPQIQEAANQVLQDAGCRLKAVVTLAKECFPTRDYDTFSLPAGVYNSLRITIGEGEGRNWWCVLFPSLCIPASSDGFEEAAQVSGMSDTLSQTLTQADSGYELRFCLLDWLGSLRAALYR